jgi:hypothetical protein
LVTFEGALADVGGVLSIGGSIAQIEGWSNGRKRFVSAGETGVILAHGFIGGVAEFVFEGVELLVEVALFALVGVPLGDLEGAGGSAFGERGRGAL